MQLVALSLVMISLIAGDQEAEKALAKGLDAERAILQRCVKEMVLIQPGQGEFPASDLAPFRISQFEVTQELYEIIARSNPSRWKGPRNSAEMFSVGEAEEFLKRLTARLQHEKLITADQAARLPTEAQWRYAAAGGTSTKFSFGDDATKIDDYCWYTGNAAGNDPAVGAKKPNPFGLYDMHGYLREMCAGVWKSADGKTIDEKQIAVLGGSWKDSADECATAARQPFAIDARDDAVGLRIVISPVAAVADAAELSPILESKKLELLWADGEFTEGPAALADGKIVFSDIGNKMYVFDPKSKETKVFRDPSRRSNGLIVDSKNRIIACEGANTGGGRQISVFTITGDQLEVTTLADQFEGRKFNSPNDIALDAEENIYFTDPRYVGDEPRELEYEGIFRVTPEGKVALATREVSKPNGIVYLAKSKSFAVSENNPMGQRRLLEMKQNDDGTLTIAKVLYTFESGRGIDGMTVDSEGRIYATAGTGDRAGVHVFSPSGKLLGVIRTPGDPTNCEFGRAGEASVLYITSAVSEKSDGKYGLFRVEVAGKRADR